MMKKKLPLSFRDGTEIKDASEGSDGRTELIEKLLAGQQPHYASFGRLLATDVYEKVGPWLEDEIRERGKPGEALCALAEFFATVVSSMVYQMLPPECDAKILSDFVSMIKTMLEEKVEALRINDPLKIVEREEA